jgi:hypothetical protein
MFCSFQEFNTPAFYLSFRKSPELLPCGACRAALFFSIPALELSTPRLRSSRKNCVDGV